MSDALLDAVRMAWRDAAAGARGLRAWRAIRTPSPGPLAVLAAVRETDGACCVLFECPIESAPAARARFEADGISLLEERNYPERIYRLSVALERRDLETIFGIVAVDLIEAAGAHTAATAAVTSLFSRLSAWQAFLRARRTGLGHEAVIGLIGELIVLRRLSTLASWAAAVDAWKGPAGGLHDFIRRGTAVEVKTSAGSAAAVEITSLDQLDDVGLAVLLLVHVHLGEAPGGVSLPSLVAAISDELQRDAPAALRGFRDALLASGYADVDADLYQGRTYQPVGLRHYKVSNGFPRLTRSEAPQGIAEARYRLELRAMQPYGMHDATAANVMRRLGETE
jgi:hypothetical protein